jgi:hypothetical protein
MSPARTLLLCLALSPGLTACSDAMCDPGPVGEPWKPYESLLPSNAVVCGPNRVSAKKPSDAKDDYPPTQVFVFYKDTNAGAAFNKTVEQFDAAGWTMADINVYGEGASAMFDAKFTKDGVEIHVGVNENDWGTQGSFSLSTPTAKP